jgi:hypothetical protein
VRYNPYRTHRERKELYIKALEDEVLRLKEIYTNVSQDKAKLAEENIHLRNMLSQQGIAFSGNASTDDDSSSPGNAFRHTPNAMSDSLPYHGSGGSSGSAFSPGVASQSSGPTHSSNNRQSPMGGEQLQRLTKQAAEQKGIDYEQAGIDFVLTYDELYQNTHPSHR